MNFRMACVPIQSTRKTLYGTIVSSQVILQMKIIPSVEHLARLMAASHYTIMKYHHTWANVMCRM